MNEIINGDIFVLAINGLLGIVLNSIFSGPFLFILLIIVGIKYGWYQLRKIKISNVHFLNLSAKVKKIVNPISQDLMNIIFGGLGLLFSWTIVNLSYTFIADMPWISADMLRDKVTVLPAQLEFAQTINNFLPYLGLVEVVLVTSAFILVMLSCIGPIFKSAAKSLGVLAMLLLILGLYAGAYADLVQMAK